MHLPGRAQVECIDGAQIELIDWRKHLQDGAQGERIDWRKHLQDGAKFVTLFCPKNA